MVSFKVYDPRAGCMWNIVFVNSDAFIDEASMILMIVESDLLQNDQKK